MFYLKLSLQKSWENKVIVKSTCLPTLRIELLSAFYLICFIVSALCHLTPSIFLNVRYICVL
jgi:hypothetical protein